jgi:hypothetical protein
MGKLGPGMGGRKSSMISKVGPGRSGWSGSMASFFVQPGKTQYTHPAMQRVSRICGTRKSWNTGVYGINRKPPGPTRTTRTSSGFSGTYETGIPGPHPAIPGPYPDLVPIHLEVSSLPHRRPSTRARRRGMGRSVAKQRSESGWRRRSWQFPAAIFTTMTLRRGDDHGYPDFDSATAGCKRPGTGADRGARRRHAPYRNDPRA